MDRFNHIMKVLNDEKDDSDINIPCTPLIGHKSVVRSMPRIPVSPVMPTVVCFDEVPSPPASPELSSPQHCTCLTNPVNRCLSCRSEFCNWCACQHIGHITQIIKLSEIDICCVCNSKPATAHCGDCDVDICSQCKAAHPSPTHDVAALSDWESAVDSTEQTSPLDAPL